MNYELSFFLLIALMVAGGVGFALFGRRSATPPSSTNPTPVTPPVTGGASTTSGRSLSGNFSKIPWTEILMLMVTGLTAWIFGRHFGWDFEQILKPLPIIFFAGTVTFLFLMILGVRKHLEVDGNGAMHAVTIVTATVFILVLLAGLFYLATELIFGSDAPVVREKGREQIAEALDPRRPDNAVTSWKLNWGVIVLTVIFLAIAIALVQGFFSKSNVVRVPVYILGIILLVWMLPKLVITYINEDHRLTPDDLRGAIETVLPAGRQVPPAVQPARPAAPAPRAAAPAQPPAPRLVQGVPCQTGAWETLVPNHNCEVVTFGTRTDYFVRVPRQGSCSFTNDVDEREIIRTVQDGLVRFSPKAGAATIRVFDLEPGIQYKRRECILTN